MRSSPKSCSPEAYNTEHTSWVSILQLAKTARSRATEAKRVHLGTSPAHPVWAGGLGLSFLLFLPGTAVYVLGSKAWEFLSRCQLCWGLGTCYIHVMQKPVLKLFTLSVLEYIHWKTLTIFIYLEIFILNDPVYNFLFYVYLWEHVYRHLCMYSAHVCI